MKIKWFKNIIAFGMVMLLGFSSLGDLGITARAMEEAPDEAIEISEEATDKETAKDNEDNLEAIEKVAEEKVIENDKEDYENPEVTSEEFSEEDILEENSESGELSLVLARQNAGNSLTEIDCLVINVGAVKKLVLAVKDQDDNLSLLSAQEGANEATITWTTLVNEDLETKAPEADPKMETTGTYIDYDISSDLKTNFNRFYKGVSKTENTFLTYAQSVALGQASNCYIRVVAKNSSTFGNLTKEIPVTVLESGEEGKSTDQPVITKIITSEEPEETYQAARDAIIERSDKAFASTVESLDMNRVFDFDSERTGMKANEGDYLKYQKSSGLQQLVGEDSVTYKGVDYHVYKMTINMATTKLQEDNVNEEILDLLYTRGSSLYDLQKLSVDNRIKAIYDYIISLETTTPTLSGDIYNTAYGLLKLNSNSSMAHALTLYRLCREANVPAKVLYDNEGHAFNLVKFSGAWYYVDCSRKLFKKNAVEFDYSKLADEFKGAAFYNNYVRQAANYSAGTGVNIKNATGTTIYTASTLDAAKEYVKEELESGRAPVSTIYTIAFDKTYTIDSLDASPVEGNVEFDLEKRTVTTPSTVSKFIVNGVVKNGTLTSTSKLYVYPGSRVDCAVNATYMYLGNLSTSGASLGSNLKPIYLNGKISTKYLNTYYWVALSSDLTYRNFYIFADNLTVTNGAKLAVGTNLLIGTKVSFAGRTYICDVSKAVDSTNENYTTSANYNSSNTPLNDSVHMLLLNNEDYPLSAGRLSLTGVLDQVATEHISVKFYDRLINRSLTSAPLAIMPVSLTDEGFVVSSYEVNDSVATLKALKAIRNGDELSAPVALTCVPGTSSNIDSYIYVPCDDAETYTEVMTLSSDGVLAYTQDNIYYELIYSSKGLEDKKVTGKTLNMASAIKLINSKKSITENKKTYNLSNVRLFFACDEELSGNLSFGAYPVEINTLKSIVSSTYPETYYGFNKAVNNVNIDIKAFKLTSGKLTINEGVTVKSTASKRGTLAASKGIFVGGSLKKISLSNAVSILPLNRVNKAVEFNDVSAVNGITLAEGSRLVLCEENTLAKLSVGGQAFLYLPEGANPVINSVAGALKNNITLVKLSGTNVSPNVEAINGKYNILDFTEREKVFTTKLTAFPVGKFELYHPTLENVVYNALEFSGDGIYTAHENFSLYIKNTESGEMDKLAGYAIWKDVLADMNQKADYEVFISDEQDFKNALKLPTRAKSVTLKKQIASGEKLVVKATGTVNLTCDFGLENIKLQAPLATIKTNNRKLTLSNADISVGTIISTSKGGLSLKDGSLEAEKTISLAGKTYLNNALLNLKLSGGNLLATGDLEMLSSTIISKGKVTLGNIYSDNDRNSICYRLTKDKKNNLTGSASAIKGFISDSQALATYRRTIEIPYGDVETVSRPTLPKQKVKACAVNLCPMEGDLEYKNPSEGFCLMTVNKAAPSWFVTGMTLVDNHVTEDRIGRGEGTERYSLSKTKALLVVGNRQADGNLLLESGYDGSYAIEGYFDSLKAASAAIDAIGDKTRDYRITLLVDTDKLVTTSGKNLDLPSKLAKLEVTSEATKSLYFGKVLGLKSNLVLNNVKLCPTTNFSISTGNYCLTIKNVVLDEGKEISSVSGVKVTGGSGLVLKNTSIKVLGKVDKLAKLELDGASLEALGAINIGELVNNNANAYEETLTGIATIHKKTGQVITSITINGSTNPLNTVTIKLKKKVGNEYQPIAFTEYDYVSFVKAPRLGTSAINVEGLESGYLTKKGAFLTLVKGSSQNLEATLNYGGEAILFETFDQALAEISSQKLKRDYSIKIIRAQGATCKKLSIPSSKYANSLTLESGLAENAEATLSINTKSITLGSNLKLKNLAVKNGTYTATDYPAALTINLGASTLSLDGVTLFNTPLVINGAKKGSLELCQEAVVYTETNGHSYSGQTSSLIVGVVKNLKKELYNQQTIEVIPMEIRK